MKRLLDFLCPQMSMPEYILPLEIWHIILKISLESEWASSSTQYQLIQTFHLVSRYWHQKLVPPVLLSLSAVSLRVLDHLSCQFWFSFEWQLDPKKIQLVSLNFRQMDPSKTSADNKALMNVLYSLPNLTALQLEGEVGGLSSTAQALVAVYSLVPDLHRLTSLKALSLLDCSIQPHGVLPYSSLPSSLVELRINSKISLTPFKFNGILNKRMTNLRSLSVPGQTHIRLDTILPLTNLTHLNISGLHLGYLTPSQRLQSLRPLTQLTSLTMDGNFKADSVPWCRANVARYLRSVKHLTVNNERENLRDLTRFPQFC